MWLPPSDYLSRLGQINATVTGGPAWRQEVSLVVVFPLEPVPATETVPNISFRQSIAAQSSGKFQRNERRRRRTRVSHSTMAP